MNAAAASLQTQAAAALPVLLLAIVLLMVAEAGWLLATGRASRARLGALAAGAGLLLAWRLSLAGAPVFSVLGCLAAAGLCHVLAWWRRRP